MNMNYSELIKSALSALRSNLLRTLLTMLGIIIGIASVILIIALGEGATKVITREIEAFGTNMVMILPGSFSDGSFATTRTLTIADAQEIENQAERFNVSAISPMVSQSTIIAANGETVSTTVMGVGAPYPGMQSLSIAHGDFLSEEDANSYARVAILGPDVVIDLFGEGADVIGTSVKIDSRTFRIIGVAQEKESIDRPPPNELVYIPYTTMMKVMLGQQHLQGIIVQTENAQLVDQTIEELTTFLRDRHDIQNPDDDDFSIQSAKDFLNTLGTITGTLTALLAGIAAISLVVGGIGIMNIMLVTVTERTREIGLLKAIGATDRDILTQFLIESLVLTLVGGIIGMTFGILLAFLITSAASIPFIISPAAVLMAVGVSSTVGVTFGFYPAWRASRLSPIDALRHE